jgi:hypothetical protein
MAKSKYQEIMKRRAALDEPHLRAIAKDASVNYITLLKVMAGIPIRTNAKERAVEILQRMELI